MELNTTIILVGVVSLLIERGFNWAFKIKKSKCCGNELEMQKDD